MPRNSPIVSDVLKQRVREIGIHQHAEQTERDDVGDRVGDFALVGVDRRRGRDDRGDAADAGAGGDQRAEARRQAELLVEPGDEHQARGDRREHHRQARRCRASATSNTLRRMPTSTMPARRMVVVANFRPGASDAGSGSGLRSSKPSTIATGTPETGLLPVRPCAARICWPMQIGEPEAREHHDERRETRQRRGKRASPVRRSQKPPITSAAADEA